jgi:sulfatase modifying factor 1
MRPGPALGCLLLAGSVLQGQDRTYTNSIGMQFVLIEPGTLLVGKFQPECPSPAAMNDSPQDPRTRWTEADYRLCGEMVKREATSGFIVTIRRPYYIGKYEVTQGEWLKVTGTTPSRFRSTRVGADTSQHPVDSVTWEDALAFIRKLNAMERTGVYRLPTEFEWEYAGRAGSTGDPAWAEIRDQAWQQDIDTAATHVVGTKKPNAWGLYDMLGNVWEWVQDYYNEKLFAGPVPPLRGTTHVLKGGGFLSDVKNAVYSTHGAGPGSGFDVGFRVVREVP